MEQELPIDIHTNKLLDWLISRRHCNREWSKGLLAVREKINNAIQDMPIHEGITKLLSGTYINYFHCLRIVEILKETESETKNIFGRYSSQRMKDWQEIVSLYERDNMYLAEAAQMLIRNTNYEIPSLKRQIAKLQQFQQECVKKSNDCEKNSNELKEKYRSSCRQIGIAGDNVSNELLKLMNDLPSVYEKVVNMCGKLQDATNYYEQFTEYILDNKTGDGQALLPQLKYLMEHGNTTIYEWRYGRKPDVIEESKINIACLANEVDNDTIDFGDVPVDDSGNGVDYGEDLKSNEDQINWDTDINNENDINFDISDVMPENNSARNEAAGVARGNDALTILDDTNTRHTFLNELAELEAFLEQRLQEMHIDSDLLSMNQFQSAVSAVQFQTSESVGKMLTDVRNILNLTNDVKVRHLLLIKVSPKYVDRLAESLKHKLSLSDKMLLLKENHLKKHKAALEEERSLLPKLELLIQRTKELQKDIENDISKKYKNRPVNLMGGVNVI